MKVTDLEVDGFGVWSGLQLAELSDQVNVFYGPNEAGKTTLLQFVHRFCLAFRPSTARYFPPLRAGRPGEQFEPWWRKTLHNQPPRR